MHSLYSAIEPYKQYTLSVDNNHTLYIEESGNPDGLPVVFLHGGPGAGCEASHRCFFNPELYRIVLFDQRGCGRSKPHAELHIISEAGHSAFEPGITDCLVQSTDAMAECIGKHNL